MGGKSLKWMGFEETFLISEMSEAEIAGFLRGHTTPPHMCEGSTAAAIAVRARSCEYDRDDDSPAVCVCFFPRRVSAPEDNCLFYERLKFGSDYMCERERPPGRGGVDLKYCC